MAPFGTTSFTSNLDGVPTVYPTPHLVVLLVLAFFLPRNSLDGEWAVLNHLPSHPQGLSRANVERMLFYSIKNVAVEKKLKIMFILNVFVPQSLTGNHTCVNTSSSSPSCHLTVTTAELAGQFWQLRIWAASPVYAHLLWLHLSYSVFFSFFFLSQSIMTECLSNSQEATSRDCITRPLSFPLNWSLQKYDLKAFSKAQYKRVQWTRCTPGPDQTRSLCWYSVHFP